MSFHKNEAIIAGRLTVPRWHRKKKGRRKASPFRTFEAPAAQAVEERLGDLGNLVALIADRFASSVVPTLDQFLEHVEVRNLLNVGKA